MKLCKGAKKCINQIKCLGDEIEIVLTGASLEESNGVVTTEHQFQMKILHVTTKMMALLLILI